MKILVVGGSGFLGRRVCVSMATAHEVHATYASRRAEVDGVTWIEQRASEAADVERLPDTVDAVVHLAQSSRYRDFPGGARDMFAVNVALTFELLEYARVAGAKQFLLASTGSVYPSDAGRPDERTACAPDAFYPASKLAAEVLTSPYSRFFTTCVLRLFFIYGPGQADRLVPNLAERIGRGEAVDLDGIDGGARLTPTHVDDVADVLHAALREQWQGTLNVASPEVLSIRQISDAIGSALGKAPRYRHSPGDRAPDLTPDLSRLEACYDMTRFRRFDIAVGEALGCRTPPAPDAAANVRL